MKDRIYQSTTNHERKTIDSSMNKKGSTTTITIGSETLEVLDASTMLRLKNIVESQEKAIRHLEDKNIKLERAIRALEQKINQINQSLKGIL